MELIVLTVAAVIVAVLASVAGVDSRSLDERHTGAIRA